MNRKFWRVFGLIVILGLVLAFATSLFAKPVDKVKFFDKRIGKNVDVVEGEI